MAIICPHCHTQFEDEPFEEIVNPTLTVTRKHIEVGTWSDIAEYITNGYAYRVIDEGDTISCKLKDGKEIQIDVAGIDVYENNEAIFCFHNLYENARMNREATNRGGFFASKMCTETLPNIWDKLPDELQSVITPRKIIQNLSEGGRAESYAKLWLPAFVEVFGDIYPDDNIEENVTRLPIFKDPRQRCRRLENEDKNAVWWLRDYYTGNTNFFYNVNSNGQNNNNNIANNSFGVLPSFKISKRKVNEV